MYVVVGSNFSCSIDMEDGSMYANSKLRDAD